MFVLKLSGIQRQLYFLNQYVLKSSILECTFKQGSLFLEFISKMKLGDQQYNFRTI